MPDSIRPDGQRSSGREAEDGDKLRDALAGQQRDAAVTDLRIAEAACAELRAEVERLRERHERVNDEVIACARRAGVSLMNPPRVPEAAQAMRAEVERLREALQPFVDAYIDADRECCPEFHGPEALEHFERAAAALERA
jgi:predicted lipid-binding transport protein (Tim44 family)